MNIDENEIREAWNHESIKNMRNKLSEKEWELAQNTDYYSEAESSDVRNYRLGFLSGHASAMKRREDHSLCDSELQKFIVRLHEVADERDVLRKELDAAKEREEKHLARIAELEASR